MKNKICVYAICKNESQFVDKWVKSVSEADNVVVLDTGSTDDTVEKLLNHGITVEKKIINPWRFDVARNESMKMIPDDCNILVCLDFDEVFDEGWADVLRNRWIEGQHKQCWYKYVWSHLPDGSDGRIFWYNKIHARGFEWKHPVHEELVIKSEYKDDYENLTNLWIDENGFKVHHYPSYKESRGTYLRLLQLRVMEDSDESNGWVYLTHQYCYERQYENCIECGKKTLNMFNNVLSNLYKSNLCWFIGYSYCNLKQYEEAMFWFNKGINEDDTYIENYLEIADTYMYHTDMDDKYEKSYNILKDCFMHVYRHYSWLEKDDSFSWRPYDLLSIASYYSGKKQESLYYAFLAREKNKNNERLSNNVNVILDNLKDFQTIML